MASSDEGRGLSTDCTQGTKPRTPSTDREKAMLRFYIIERVLSSLGFASERVAECLGALDGEASWEDALEWVSPRNSIIGWPVDSIDVASL